MALKLNLAVGQRPMRGYKGVDIVDGEHVDEVVDLEAYPWPWADGSVAALYCSHFVEHVQDLISFMNEAYRVCRFGALFTIVHPYYSSIRAWQDPTHVRALSENSWIYYDRSWREREGLDHYPITANFSVMQVGASLEEDWLDKSEEEQRWGRRHLLNVVRDLEVTLVAEK